MQCRLSDVAPVRAAGFDHTTQGSYAVAAGVSKALGLNPVKTANAIAYLRRRFQCLAGHAHGQALSLEGIGVSRTPLPLARLRRFLAMRGVTGPLEVFEGEKGFMDAIAGCFQIDWSQENLERVTATILKKYNAEVHSQTAIECALQLRAAGEIHSHGDRADRRGNIRRRLPHNWRRG